jgi:uncharacterized protein (TIGR02687 family)
MTDLHAKIESQFQKNPALKVLFFFDPQQEYSTEIGSMEMPAVHIIQASSGLFNLKVRLETELKKEKTFLYFSRQRPNDKEKTKFILMDLLIANKELHLDDEADFMDEFHLLAHQRSIVHRYIKALKLKKHQKVLAKILNVHDFKENDVIKGLISNHLEFSTIMDPGQCLAKLFTLTLSENSEKLQSFLEKLDYDELRDAVLAWLHQYLDMTGSSLTPELLKSAIRKVKYNALTQHLHDVKGQDPYGLMKIRDHLVVQKLNGLLVGWSNDAKLGKLMDPVFSQIGAEIREKEIVDTYGVESGYVFFTQDLKYILLARALELIEHQPQKVHEILQSFSSSQGEKSLTMLVRFVGSTANFFKQLKGYAGYKLDSPQQYIDHYTKDYYQVDTHYRSAISSWEALQKLTLPGTIHLDALINLIHDKYETHLIELNREWIACLAENQFKLKAIPVKKQYEFATKFVNDDDQKVAVIISDALRYEVGQELLKQLLLDTKGHASIDYVLSGIPSITKWGMAHLLSSEKIQFDDLKLSISGISTEGTENRQKILKLTDNSAVAVTYKTLMGIADREEVRDKYFNQKQIIYIYHDVIDSTGDVRKTELETFSAVQKTIEDLASLVKKVHSSYNISRVLITADHGFLFNYRPLSDATLQDMPKGKHTEEHSRYLLTNDTKQCSNGYILNLEDCSNVNSELKLVIPKGVNRFRRKGAGYHFVHGGASLQEMVVPVIESTRKRKDISKKVEFSLMNQEFKIVSGAIKLKIHQNNPVGSAIKPLQIVACIYNSTGTIVSNEAYHHLDSVSEIPSERTREFILNLSSGAGQESVLTLKIFDKDDVDRLNPLLTEKVINNTLIETDF